MNGAADMSRPGCAGCTSDAPPFEISFAFQPIVDMRNGRIESYEALVHGPNGEPASTVLTTVSTESAYRFDQACRTTAIALAARLGMTTKLNLNFMPNAVYRPEQCIRSTLAAARAARFPIDRIVFEVVESERTDGVHLCNILTEYKRLGFATAIDDFGAGYSGLGLLVDFQPDLIKIDIKLVRDVDSSPARQAIVRSVVALCRDLGIRTVGEGVETREEYTWLAQAGVDLFQGFYFARPAFEALPTVELDRFRKLAAFRPSSSRVSA